MTGAEVIAMARVSKIEQNNLAAEVLELSLTHTTRDIAEILLRDHGLDISHNAIAVWLKGTRRERREQTKAVVEEHIKATVPRDLDLLDAIIDDLRQVYFGERPVTYIKDDGTPVELTNIELGDKLSVAREIRQTVATKLRYSGAGEGSGAGTLEEALDGLDDDSGG